MVVLADRVRETSSSSGTGPFTLGGPYAGFQSFAGGVGDGNTTFYAIIELGGDQWEVGQGVYNAGVLTRETVLESSNSGQLVNFSAGTKEVFVTAPGKYLERLDSNQFLRVDSDTHAVPRDRLWLVGDVEITLSNPVEGGTVVLTKSVSATPTIVSQAPAQILTEKGPTDSVLFDINAEITFVFNGTDWEL